MVFKHNVKLLLTMLLLLFPLALMAQDDGERTPQPTPEATAAAEATAESTPAVDDSCPAIVERAIQLTQTGCEGVGNNDVCYGHLLLDAVLRGSSEEARFEDPGDVIDVAEVENLSLSALDTVRGIWGVVLLQIDATFEQVANNDEITYVVFGDAELQSANQLILVNTTIASNIRAEPATDAGVVRSVEADTVIVASGITEDGEWLRIRLQAEDEETEEEETITGWLAVDLIDVVDETLSLTDLPVVNPDEAVEDTVAFGPMQAFYFESGRDDSPCEAAPESGVLIQTPEGQAKVSVWIDEVVVELSATAFVQANAGGDITINVLDGAATVTANGETRTATEGTAISVPLDDELGAAGVPSDPQPIDPDDLNALPTTLLPEEIELPEPIAAGSPAAGNWLWAWGVESLTCDDPENTVISFESSGVPNTLTITPDGSTFTFGGATYTRSEPSVYTNTYIDGNGNLHQDTLTVQSLDRINGLKIVDYATVVCSLEVPFSLTLTGP